MLGEIRIDCLGAISSATVHFSPGLTVLTGETGAGKTMVVTSLHLLSGARADAGRVRVGAQRAVVEGRFTTDGIPESAEASVAEMLAACGAERDEDGSVIAARTVNSDGRSRAHLGGRSVPASVLSEFTSAVLTVHGQNDQLRLQRPEQQRRALDEFAGDSVLATLKSYRTLRATWLAARTELSERTQRSRELAQEADRLEHALKEIDTIAPTPGEDDSLMADIRRLSDLDVLRESAETAHLALVGDAHGGAEGALDLLGTVRGRLQSSTDTMLSELAPRLDEAVAVAADIAAELSDYLSALPSDPGALDSMLTRQAELKLLTRKYAADINGVLAWADEARARLANIDTSAEAISLLTKQVQESEAQLKKTAAKLTKARQKAAKELSGLVTAELAGLAMGKSKFDVEVRELAEFGAEGADEVEFRLAGAGGRPLPIAKSASGGELSRVMLALEVVLARSSHGTTMVFDEVDAGVGGRAAVEIGKRLAQLARTHQVIVVTHLPQVAAFADTHIVVDKNDDGPGVADSGVHRLSDGERVVELARMLAGLGDTETGRAHAEELLAAAAAVRS
ncbi:MAG: DNA repair protein RecN [Nocardiaceae bacterium]|nr:DNA repair protein RecN [Nocardiaceae bacterium]